MREPLLGPAAPEELADLRADGRQRPQQRVVELVRLAGVELEHAEHLAAVADRDPRPAPQSRARRGLGAPVARLGRHGPGAPRLPGLPHAPHRPGAPLQPQPRGQRAELLHGDPLAPPQRLAAERAGVLVEEPRRAEVPVHRLAERAQQRGDRRVDRGRLRERARDRVLGGDLARDPAAVREVAQIAGEERRLGAGDARDRQLHRELAAVAAHPGQLEPRVEDLRHARVQVAREPLPVGVAQRRRDDQLRELAPDRGVARVPEGALGARG